MVLLHVVLAVHLLPADLPALAIVERHSAGRLCSPPTALALPAAPQAPPGRASELPVAAEVARVAEALAAVVADVVALVEAPEKNMHVI